MLVQYIVPIVILTVATIVGKALLLTGGLLASGENLRDSLFGAMSQTQIGEFSFIIANLGISLGVTSDFLYPVVVAVSVVTTFTTPYLIRSVDGVEKLLNKVMPQKWRNNIRRYQNEKAASSKKPKDMDWKQFLKGYSTTFLIYGILLFGITELGRLAFLPALSDALQNSTVAAVLLSLIHI